MISASRPTARVSSTPFIGPEAATTAANTSRYRPPSTSSPMPDRHTGGRSPCPAPKPPDPTAAAVSPPDGTGTGVFTGLSPANTDTSSSRPTRARSTRSRAASTSA
ncbi:hypothetical protein ACFQ51_43015 [Streptomyces kaempferi]